MSWIVAKTPVAPPGAAPRPRPRGPGGADAPPLLSLKQKLALFVFATGFGALGVLLYLVSDGPEKPLYPLAPFCHSFANVALVIYLGLFLVPYLPRFFTNAMHQFHEHYTLPIL